MLVPLSGHGPDHAPWVCTVGTNEPSLNVKIHQKLRNMERVCPWLSTAFIVQGVAD